jgi:general secretion pathway protein G
LMVESPPARRGRQASATSLHLAFKLRYPEKVDSMLHRLSRAALPAHAQAKQTALLIRGSKKPKRFERGLTLLELILASSILLILASAALPVVRVTIVRSKEARLHKALREMRDAIDHYKDYADRNLIRVEVGSEGYPPDLETLVKGVRIGASSDRKVRFLRRIPVDPMTGRAEWNLQAVQDDPDSTSWGGKNVFDVHSKSTGTALDGTHYADW